MAPVSALSTSAIAAIGKTQCKSVSAGDVAIFSFTDSLLPISSITISIFDQCNSMRACQEVYQKTHIRGDVGTQLVIDLQAKSDCCPEP